MGPAGRLWPAIIMKRFLLAPAAALAMLVAAGATLAYSLDPGQIVRGVAVYREFCAVCHGPSLQGAAGPSLLVAGIRGSLSDGAFAVRANPDGDAAHRPGQPQRPAVLGRHRLHPAAPRGGVWRRAGARERGRSRAAAVTGTDSTANYDFAHSDHRPHGPANPGRVGQYAATGPVDLGAASHISGELRIYFLEFQTSPFKDLDEDDLQSATQFEI